MGIAISHADSVNHHQPQHRRDVVCVFSNGGFGNIHAKLLERLESR